MKSTSALIPIVFGVTAISFVGFFGALVYFCNDLSSFQEKLRQDLKELQVAKGVLLTNATVEIPCILALAFVPLGLASLITFIQMNGNDIWKMMQNDLQGRTKRQDSYPTRIEPSECPPGPPGPPGARGLKGEDGEPGNDGVPGQHGFSEEGYSKSDGACISCPQGSPGPMGEDGPPGPPGNDGQPGDDGASNNELIPGPPGPPGEPGASGRPGAAGSDGEPGANGQKTINAPGQQGPPGPPGEPGSSGEDNFEQPPNAGPPGPPGPPGKDGMPGEPGQPGPQGTSGGPGNDAAYCPCPARTVLLAETASPQHTVPPYSHLVQPEAISPQEEPVSTRGEASSSEGSAQVQVDPSGNNVFEDRRRTRKRTANRVNRSSRNQRSRARELHKGEVQDGRI